MKKTKYIGMIVIATSTLLFSGCVAHRTDSFPVQNSYHNNSTYDYDTRAHINNSLLSYAYPYYFDRPFYYLDGRYFYGGFFRDGFYHYGNRRLRHGHYYSRGYRYYNGRRYRAINRQYGYFRDRNSYRHSNYYRNRDRNSVRRLNRGRQYRSREYNRKDSYYKNSWDNNINRKLHHAEDIVKNRANKHISKHAVKRPPRQRPER